MIASLPINEGDIAEESNSGSGSGTASASVSFGILSGKTAGGIHAGGGHGGGGNTAVGGRFTRGLVLHRSNSSLELPHSPEPNSTRLADASLRREYGSHGSIDVAAAQSGATLDEKVAMLLEWRPGPTGTTIATSTTSTATTTASSVTRLEQQRAQPSLGDYRSRRTSIGLSPDGQPASDIDEVCGSSSASTSGGGGSASPKLRSKINRLWGAATARPCRTMEESCGNSSAMAWPDLEERHRRRAFAHYDCQSLTANLGYAAKLRGILLARRRNTATGASAASSLRASSPDEPAIEEDLGDGKGNELLESCPFFRNEIGGEGEREVGLTRGCSEVNGIHRPALAYGVSVLEPPPGETLWKQTCPVQRRPLPIETIDEGAHYYRRYFLGREHQNWFGVDEQLGPVAISIRKDGNQYRIIVRTAELLTLRGSVPEEALGLARPTQPGRIPTRELLELVAPEVQLSCLRLGTSAAEEAIARLDEQGLSTRYKVGVLYCRAGQRTEEEMYNNQHAGPAFLEFLDAIGQRVRLRGFEGYKAGLDTKTDSTGTHAVFATHRGAEVMFHVSTMLPFTPNNRQQLLRKRHIGNDIVTIVFQEPGAHPFSPRRIRSQFQHVFIVVRAINPCSDSTQYIVAVSRSKEVPVFGPPVPPGATFTKGKAFAEFILAKVINAENAAHRSEKFATMATRTRQGYLKDIASNCLSSTVVDTGQKFSMLSFSSKKKSAIRPRLSCEASQRGAICWQVILEDSNQNTDCYLGISVDSIVLIEEHSRQIVFVSPCIGVLGWHAQTNSLRLYYHQGECITIHVRADYGERDELMEIVARLRAVTKGAPATELSLKRNSLGQLGFHVQPDGVVTQVESMGLSWQAGLRQGSRLVEICKIAVSTLSHDQMVDLLKTSAQVTVTVIPPNNDGSPRRGCTLQNCQYLANNYEGDYENVTCPPVDNPASQQTAMSHQRRYERSFSPPRSSNSSGYGTGSSSRSFNDPRIPLEGTMTSSSSGHSSADDRWYELLESQDASHDGGYRLDGTPPPPPLPVRQNYQHSLGNFLSDPRREKDSARCYSSGGGAGAKQSAEDSKHHSHEQHCSLESGYVSTKALQDYQRQLDTVHRNPEHTTVTNSYVKHQRDKFEVRDQQENPYASQRELRKVQVDVSAPQTPTQHSAHQKLGTSNSAPLQPSVRPHGIRKSTNGSYSNNRIGRCNDYEHVPAAACKYEYDEEYDCEHDHDHETEREHQQRTHGQVQKPQQQQQTSARSHEYGYEFDYEYEYKTEFDKEHNTKCGSTEDEKDERGPRTAELLSDRTLRAIAYDCRNGRYDSETERDERRRANESEQQIRESVTREGQYDFKLGAKVTCLKTNISERATPHKINVEYRQSKDFPTGSLPADLSCASADGGGTLASEDELSNGSGNVSPRLRRANRHITSGNLTPSASSRNQSPKPRMNVRSSHRNSANITGSTLQEDLMKLINPDYISDDGPPASNNNVALSNAMSFSNTSNQVNTANKQNNNVVFEVEGRCRSRENLCGMNANVASLGVLPSGTTQETGNNPSEVILTMARPATVISNASTASSPAPSENKLSKEERLSPRATKPVHSTTSKSSVNHLVKDLALNDQVKSRVEVEVDRWPTHDGKHELCSKKHDQHGQHAQEWAGERYVDGRNPVTNSVTELQSHLSTLELRVARETRRRLSLEDEVRRLRDENRRLQDESHAAAQQLRRFTEWFFQTIDHQ